MISQLPLERQLVSFLEQLLDHHKIDLVVCVERKGTAIFRALMEEIPGPKLRWDWSRVCSTTAMESFHWDKWRDARILLFDELVHHGRRLKKERETLCGMIGPESTVVTAAYAVWSGCLFPPDEAYRASVDSGTYEGIRDDIVRLLQVCGSLLLDTEHVELTVRLACSVREFFEGIARCAPNGQAVSFLSGADRLNLTINQPDILDEEAFNRWLPRGTTFKGAVQKCRVVQRRQNEFAIIPISYPTVPCDVDPSWVERLPGFIDKTLLRAKRPKDIFYTVGLLTSIELLRSIVAALGDLRKKGRLVIEVGEGSVQHLKAMFPTLDCDGLLKHVQETVALGMIMQPQRTASAVSVHPIPQDVLLEMAGSRMERLISEMDNLDEEEIVPRGRAWSYLASSESIDQERMAHTPGEWAAVPDRLIDGGMIVTDVESVTRQNGSCWAIRTFRPDSEIVVDRLRRQLSVKGKLCLAPT